MDVVQPVMRGRDRQDPARGASGQAAVAAPEIGHEVRHPRGRGRLVPPDPDFLSGLPELARHDRGTGSLMLDEAELLRHLHVEAAMDPAQELRRERIRQPVVPRLPVDPFLHPDMGQRLLCKRPVLDTVHAPLEGGLDVGRSGVVALDQVRIVGVHQSHHDADLGRAVGMQRPADQPRLLADRDDEVGEPLRDSVLDSAWLDPCRCLEVLHAGFLACFSLCK